MEKLRHLVSAEIWAGSRAAIRARFFSSQLITEAKREQTSGSQIPDYSNEKDEDEMEPWECAPFFPFLAERSALCDIHFT